MQETIGRHQVEEGLPLCEQAEQKEKGYLTGSLMCILSIAATNFISFSLSFASSH
jgi:hypothetical protein